MMDNDEQRRDREEASEALRAVGVQVSGVSVEMPGPKRTIYVATGTGIGPTLHEMKFRLTFQVVRHASAARAVARAVTTFGSRLDAVEAITGERIPLPISEGVVAVDHLLIERHSAGELAAGFPSLREGVAHHVRSLYRGHVENSQVSALGNRILAIADGRGPEWMEGPQAMGTRVSWMHDLDDEYADLHDDRLHVRLVLPESALAILPGRRVREVASGTIVDDYVIRSAKPGTAEKEGWLRLNLIPQPVALAELEEECASHE